MDFTLSDSYYTHTGTGQRMHKEQQAVPTAWSEKDANMVIWSLMEVVKAGGLAGVQFDPDVPSSYQVVLNAIRNLYAASSSDLPGRVSIFLQPTAPAGWIKANGVLLSRATYSALWAHVQTVGAVSEADWFGASMHGWFSSGDGSTTFRVPDLRGVFLRGFDDGRGLDAGRLLGSYQLSQNQSHAHGVNDPQHAHAVNDPQHAHGVTDPQHAHGVNDPQHAHTTTLTARWGTANAGTAGWGGDDAAGVTQANATNAVPTGITIQANGTGVSIQAGATGVSIQATATGITIQSSGGSEARPVSVALPFYIKY
jgi:microcystin-dependent protein